MTAVTISNVSRSFGQTLAVDGVTLDIAEGEFVSILGPSGCGKTTLLRIVAGLEQPSSGRIFIRGRDVTGLPPEKRPTNMVFQHGALFPHRTVFENVAYGLQRKHVPKRELQSRVDRALELVRLRDFGARRPTELSGGEARRVALARALVLEPSVLLLDEPLSALDLQLRKHMQLELRTIHREVGTTFVYVTHDQGEALTMSDRVVVMRQGHVVQQGVPRELYEKPESLFVASFIGEVNLIPGRISAVADGFVTVTPFSMNSPLEAVGSGAVGDPVTVAIRPQAVEIRPAGPAPIEAGVNQAGGEVTEVIFLGDHARVCVSVSEDINLWAQPADTSPTKLPAIGDRLSVTWTKTDAQLHSTDLQ